LSEGHKDLGEAVATEEGCQVDLSWLAGREVVAASSGLDKLVITFRDGQTLSIQASVWKGAAFLAFTPWKAPS
jgi:hypothetical protein